jgi:hypothetical protein
MKGSPPSDEDAAAEAGVETLRGNLFTAGWLVGLSQPKAILLASRARGEGVTTLTTTLAKSCAAKSKSPVLVVYGSGRKDLDVYDGVEGLSAEYVQQSVPAARSMIAAGDPGKPHILTLNDGPVELAAYQDFYGDLITQLKDTYPIILIDAGSMSDDMLLVWRRIVDLAALVIDVRQSQQDVLENFRRELDRSVIKFDGFITNRRKYFIPDFLFRWVS